MTVLDLLVTSLQCVFYKWDNLNNTNNHTNHIEERKWENRSKWSVNQQASRKTNVNFTISILVGISEKFEKVKELTIIIFLFQNHA